MEFTGIDQFSLLDYDDYLSVVLFSPACNFRCPFCHNGLTVLESKTIIPFDEIIAYLKTRIGRIDAVVFTGGEPTLMKELPERIAEVKKLGFKIKLDTNGTRPDVLENLLNKGLLDYVAMDVKNTLSAYPETCGVKTIDEEAIKRSIAILKVNKTDYEFRTTLVKEFHNKQRIKEMGSLIKGAKKLYLQKFVERDGVILKGLHPVSEKEALEFLKILQNDVENVYLRGY